MAKASNRLLVKQRFSSPRRKLPLYGSKGSVLVTRTLTGAGLMPRSRKGALICTPSKKKPLTKDMCKSELYFGPTGLMLRFCTTRGKPAPSIPVSSPREATKLGHDFCKCVKKTKNVKACATKVSKGGALGRYRRRR